MSSDTIYLALGSNVGDRLENIVAALRQLQEKVTIQHVSSIYTSQPMYILDQAEFYNLVIEVTTDLMPEELLRFCKEIEQDVGRVQRQRNGPREIDIDILFYGSLEVNSQKLTIPHPRVSERPFVVVPLAEIASEHEYLVQKLGEFEELVLSVSGEKLQELLDSGILLQ